MEKVLVIAAHPDDEILGLGGAIKKRVDNGDEVYALILGEGMTSRSVDRSDTNQGVLLELHADTMKSAEVIGYKSVFFADLPDNRFDSVDLLDIIKIVEKYIDIICPSVIYTHHCGDMNIDHQLTNQAVLTATRPIKPCGVKEVYGFETASSTEWNFRYGTDVFTPNVFVDITDYLDYKLQAMAHYKSEIRDYPHPRSLRALRAIAERWGSVSGCEYAEAFQLIRKID